MTKDDAMDATAAEKAPLVEKGCCDVQTSDGEATTCCPSLFKAEKAGENVSNGVAASVALNPLIWLLWLLDFLVWLIYFLIIGWIIALYKACTKVIPGKKTASGTWRQNYVTAPEWTEGELCTKPMGTEAATAWDCFDAAFKQHAALPCMGTRTYLGTHIVDPTKKPSGHNPQRKVYGPTDWKTYGAIQDRALAFGRGLRELGMTPSTALGKQQFEATNELDTLLLWENTCADWMTGLAGAFSQSMVVATSYATLGADGMLGSIEECGCKVLVCNRDQVAKCIQALTPEAQKTLTTIIYTDLDQCTNTTVEGTKHQATGHPKGDLKIAEGLSLAPKRMENLIVEGLPEGMQVLSFEEVVTMGCKNVQHAATPPKPDNIAVVMYTSGSTGKPKGVCIAHRNLCASIGSMHANFSEWGKLGEEVYVAYLPAAHILELVAEIAMLSFGSQIGYADPRSISSKGACRAFKGTDGNVEINFEADLVNAPGAVQEFKPTCLAAVPKIWEIFKQTVEGGVSNGGYLQRAIFEAAFAAVKNAATWRYCPLLNLLFTKKIGAVVGGRMKAGISGGGALSPEVQNFCRICFGFPLIQGYALTETCCGGCVQLPNDSEDGIVGACMASVELKLTDCPGFKDKAGKDYLEVDNKHPIEKMADGSWKYMDCAGRGEVWIRGPSVSLGYYAKSDSEEQITLALTPEVERETLMKGMDETKKGETEALLKSSMTAKTMDEFSIDNKQFPNSGPAPKLAEFSWFKTGDIAVFTPDGRLKIVDRKKNLVKLKGGEYISYEAMEKAYGNSKYVNSLNGGVMCWGSGDVDKAIALVQVNCSAVAADAHNKGIKVDNDTAEGQNAMCENPEVIKMVMDDLKKVGKAGKLAPNEGLGAIALISGTGPGLEVGLAVAGSLHSAWTPDNGYLTASNKTDRNAILHGKDDRGSVGHESTIMKIAGIDQV